MLSAANELPDNAIKREALAGAANVLGGLYDSAIKSNSRIANAYHALVDQYYGQLFDLVL